MALEEELERKFEEAYEIASNTKQKFPPDLLLQFYAYYKRATNQAYARPMQSDANLVDAFKMNALFQVKNLSRREAMQAYIDLVEKHITNKDKSSYQ